MPRNRISLSEENVKIISFKEFSSYGTNCADRDKMRSILSKAIASELTDRQRECVVNYYYGGMSTTQIASNLNLNKSTVARHIKAAKRRLSHLASYY